RHGAAGWRAGAGAAGRDRRQLCLGAGSTGALRPRHSGDRGRRGAVAGRAARALDGPRERALPPTAAGHRAGPGRLVMRRWLFTSVVLMLACQGKPEVPPVDVAALSWPTLSLSQVDED